VTIYTFTAADPEDGITVTVEFDDTADPTLPALLRAFEQFLLGVTFQPGTIAKYIPRDGL
jgi:hypothetical protein